MAIEHADEIKLTPIEKSLRADPMIQILHNGTDMILFKSVHGDAIYVCNKNAQRHHNDSGSVRITADGKDLLADSPVGQMHITQGENRPAIRIVG